jgi:hypothetical protein
LVAAEGVGSQQINDGVVGLATKVIKEIGGNMEGPEEELVSFGHSIDDLVDDLEPNYKSGENGRDNAGTKMTAETVVGLSTFSRGESSKFFIKVL